MKKTPEKKCSHEWKAIVVNGYPSRDKQGNIIAKCNKCNKIGKG